MADISEDEKVVLDGFAYNVIGGPDDKCMLREPYQSALESLKAKGLIHRVWVLSPEGYKAIGIDPKDAECP